MVKEVRIIREGRMVVTVMDSVSAMEQEKTSANIEWSTLPYHPEMEGKGFLWVTFMEVAGVGFWSMGKVHHKTAIRRKDKAMEGGELLGLTIKASLALSSLK